MEKIDKRKFNGGHKNGGRKKKTIIAGDSLTKALIEVEKSVLVACKKKHKTYANALRFAANN